MPAAVAPTEASPPLSVRRLLVLGGIALVIAGMVFGDIFAVFGLHQNAGLIGQRLLAATRAVAAGDAAAVLAHFNTIGGLLENRGTKVDAHVHVTDFGYLALLLALVQPYVSLAEDRKKRLAQLFLAGASLLPVSVFLIHYVGLAYSPLRSIGWASIFADFGGLLVILACLGELGGLWASLRGAHHAAREDESLADRSRPARVLLAGGTLLVLAGFILGAYYATFDLYRHEARDKDLLGLMMGRAAANDLGAAARAVADYGALEAEKAVKIAAHAHIIEFGALALLLAFLQPYVFLSERWKRRWAMTLLLGSTVLPVFVLLELPWGLSAGGVADAGGLLVVVALTAMLAGVVRGGAGIPAGRPSVDKAADRWPARMPAPLSAPQKLLIAGGLILALWGMGYGLYYALFEEHQALDRIGASLAGAFAGAAERKWPEASTLLDAYARAKFDYVRQVDVHSHWTGLALLLIILGLTLDRGIFSERRALLVAWMLVAGSAIFPLGVLLEIADRGVIPQALAAIGAGLVTAGLGGAAVGFARISYRR